MIQRFGLLTSGSIPFGNSDGLMAQDNTNLFWNDSTKLLTLSGVSSTQAWLASTTVNFSNALVFSSSTGKLHAYAGSSCGGSDQVTSISPTGTVTCSPQGAGGNGTVTTSSVVSVNHFPYWVSDGGLNGTSTLIFSTSKLLASVDFNASGTITTNGTQVSTSTGANPTASLGLTAVNGSANTFMRSDGAPALSQSITPTWTGLHIFSGAGISSTQSWLASTTLNDFTNAIAVVSSTGKLVPYTAQDCGGGNFVRTISATGTVGCAADTGGSGGIATSTAGDYTEGNLGFFLNHSTLSASTSLRYTSSTGLFQNFGVSSSTELRSPSSTITTFRFTNASGTDFTASGYIQALTGFHGSSTMTWGGNANVTGTLSVRGGTVTTSTGANPSASVGLTAVNGTANTFLRSDGAPALSQSIVPTWTGLHQFSGSGASTTQLWSASTTLSGNFSFASGTSTTNLALSYSTASRCLRLDAGKNIVAASGDCASGDTTNLGTVTTSTAVTANYFPFWNSSNGSGLNGTSSIFQSGLSIGVGTTQPSSTLHVFGTFGASQTSTIAQGLSIGTTTNPVSPVVLNVVGSGTSTIKFGDASSSKPACFMFSDYPAGTSWTYVYFNAGAMTATTTPCN